MNNTSNSIISAMEIMAKKWAGENSRYDRTVKAIIKEYATEGAYRIYLEGNEAIAHTNSDIAYSAGDEVYVRIYEGDYSQIWIEGEAIKTKEEIEKEEKEKLTYSRCQIPVSKMYNTNWEADKALIAGYGDPSIVIADSLSDHNIYKTYSDDYNYLEIYAEFKTQFFDTHNVGNYGLKIEVQKTEGTVVTYTFDITQFNGDVYKFQTYVPQTMLIPIGFNTEGIKSISFFQEGFNTDKQFKGYSENNEKVQVNIITPNIFVRNTELYLSLGPEAQIGGYQLTFNAPDGYKLSETTEEKEGIEELSVTPQLRFNGKTLDNVDYTWFKQDLSVTIGSSEYSSLAGYGWKSCGQEGNNTFTFGIETKDDVSNYEQVAYKEKFKVVANYGELVQCVEEIEIENISAIIPCKIVQKKEAEKLYLKLQPIVSEDETEYLGNWYCSQLYNGYQKLNTEKEEKTNEIDISDLLNYTEVVFYCHAYSGDTEIGILEYKFTIPQAKGDMSLVFTGVDSFRYDASGDITTDADKTYNLECNIIFPEGVNAATKISWLDSEKGNISSDKDEPTIPTNSLITKMWVDNDNKLCYTINSRYNINSVNNMIYVRVNTLADGKQYDFEKQIEFLKDGDPGTNGTSYTVTIKPYKIIEAEEQANVVYLDGFQPIHYENNNWTTLNLASIVKKNGQDISSENYKCDWKYVNVCGIATGVNTSVKMLDNNPLDEATATLPRYVTATITIEEANGEKIKLYSFYPIDIFVGDYNNLVNINDNYLPKHIQYNSSGENPIYSSSAIKAYYNDSEMYIQQVKPVKETENSTTYSGSDFTITTITKDYEQEKEIDLLGIGFNAATSAYLNPISKFIYAEERMALIKCFLNNEYILRTVILYLNTYGNEAINGWDGTEVEVGFEQDDSAEYTEGRRYYIKIDGKNEYKEINFDPYEDADGNILIIDLERFKIENPNAPIYWFYEDNKYEAKKYYYRTSIFAPQVGAGVKNDDNTFTGVVMGKDSQQDKIGLYGYQKGLNTFGLQEDGSAYFGKYNSRIWIKPNTNPNLPDEAIIYGGGGDNEKYPDFKISLTKKENTQGQPAIQIGYVSPEDQMNENPNLTSAVGKYKFMVDYEGKMTAEAGKIGEWYITGGILKSINNITSLNGNTGIITTEAINIGTIGLVGLYKGHDGINETNCLGFQSSYNSIVLDSDINIRFKGKTIFLDSYNIQVRSSSSETGWTPLSTTAVFG